MELASSNVGEAVACYFGCDAVAEPEQDGDTAYLHCPDCGNDFGFQREVVSVTANPGGTCAVGVPEQLRRRASAGMENALRRQPPLLQIGRRDASPS